MKQKMSSKMFLNHIFISKLPPELIYIISKFTGKFIYFKPIKKYLVNYKLKNNKYNNKYYIRI